MIIRCVLCGKTIGDKPPFGGKYDRVVTPGICPECMAKPLPKVKTK